MFNIFKQKIYSKVPQNLKCLLDFWINVVLFAENLYYFNKITGTLISPNNTEKIMNGKISTTEKLGGFISGSNPF